MVKSQKKKMPENVDNTTSNRLGKDITKEIQVNPEDVKICDVEELAPSSSPITVPYLEIYRTNELEYIPYISPYNVGVGAGSSDDSSSDTGSDTMTTDENNTGDNNSDSSDNSNDNNDENNDDSSNNSNP